jgi:hypothetical protein
MPWLRDLIARAFRRISRRRARRSSPPAGRRVCRRVPEVEELEGRLLLAWTSIGPSP